MPFDELFDAAYMPEEEYFDGIDGLGEEDGLVPLSQFADLVCGDYDECSSCDCKDDDTILDCGYFEEFGYDDRIPPPEEIAPDVMMEMMMD